MASMTGIIIFVHLLLMASHTDSQPIREVNDLKCLLMKNYNRITKPSSRVEDIEVMVEAYIKKIGDLDEGSQKLTTVVQFYISWKDEQIAWDDLPTDKVSDYNVSDNNVSDNNVSDNNVSDYNVIKSVQFDAAEVWTPRLYVLNKHYTSRRQDEDNVMYPVEYTHSGSALLIQVIIAETSCNLDLTKYPFDSQTCIICFYVNKKHVYLRPVWREFILEPFEPDGSWDVTNASIFSRGNYVDIELKLTRKPGFVLIQFVIPMTILAFLSPLAFLLPNQSGERVGFSITTLLAISVYMSLIAGHLPQKSHPLPHTIVMLFLSYVLTSIVIVVVLINARIYRLPDNVPIPRALKMFMSAMRCLCYCFRPRGRKLKDDIKEVAYGDVVAEECHEKRKVEEDITWMDVSWAIDMFFMTVLYLAKLVLLVEFLVVLNM